MILAFIFGYLTSKLLKYFIFTVILLYFLKVSITLVPEIMYVRHFSSWYLEINSLVPEVAFRRSR